MLGSTGEAVSFGACAAEQAHNDTQRVCGQSSIELYHAHACVITCPALSMKQAQSSPLEVVVIVSITILTEHHVLRTTPRDETPDSAFCVVPILCTLE